MTMQQEEQKMIADAIAQFPPEFGLRAFPGDVFALSRSKSYVTSEGVVQLVTVVRRMVQHAGDGNQRAEWMDFAKGTIRELLGEVVPLG